KDGIRDRTVTGVQTCALPISEEEEMNHRRRLLNAAKKGDQKAIGKLLELYQVRIYSGDMVTKMNKTSATHKLQAQLAEGKPVKGDRKSTRLNSSHRTISYAVF